MNIKQIFNNNPKKARQFIHIACMYNWILIVFMQAYHVDPYISNKLIPLFFVLPGTILMLLAIYTNIRYRCCNKSTLIFPIVLNIQMLLIIQKK